MAEGGSMECPFSEAGCVFSCADAAEMENHLKMGSLDHQLHLMSTLKVVMAENKALSAWKEAHELKAQNNGHSCCGSYDVNTIKQRQAQMDSKIVNLAANSRVLYTELKAVKEQLATQKDPPEMPKPENDVDLTELKALLTSTQRSTVSLVCDVGLWPSDASSFTWEIAHFSRWAQVLARRDLECIHSPYLYIKGYKMRLIVLPKGRVGGSESYVSVYLWLERGNYDADLTWPFPHSISLEILDVTDPRGEKGVKHIVPAEEFAYNPVQPREKMHYSVGVRDFLPVEELDSTNCRYLKNDKMYVRLTVL